MRKGLIRYSAIALLIAVIMVCGCTSGEAKDNRADTGSASEESLIVYCGAGLRVPMETAAEVFEEKDGIKIKYSYGGAAQLLSQMELLGEGDLYMPGAKAYLDSAAEKGFISDTRDVVYHVIAIAVEKGNPKNITCLKDLTRDGVRVGIGEPDGPAVGKAAKKIFEKNEMWESVQDNIVVQSGTVNELLVFLKMDQADAVVIWEDLLNPEDMEIVNIPVKEGFVKVVPIATLEFSEHPENAVKFMEFVSSDEGKEIFTNAGFDTYPCEKYAGVQ
ncbi:molybdate ABC transporter substrate-binding protein [Methanoplanus limicola]|uniref:Molybdenum ABC transporter, periplasmic molybdate-binding protein n=1 Tax=Methanoplanus limicola DSM 2279 TaxID=937775 RepID=H1YXZ4_9EURY|nr:molybdate ABC transporter substrate-binding protein [Methanoplanus limicola]EHQ36929.1 molybdenum ABC transporter, periplasmic molybdate-binding protein [Methanoplanus limicola DSM 2279]